MPKRLNQSKKEAIFQLCNFLCNKGISQITDLANGEILLKTIEARFGPFSEAEVQSSEVDDLRNNAESNCINISNGNPENESNLATNEKYIFLQHVKKFIDDHYNIESENFIKYENCINFDDFEILKMAVFVLSEIIRHLHETNSEDLMSLYHFDVKFQVELEGIFKLFITEREKLNKDEVDNLLSKQAKKASPFATPRRTSARHREQLLESSSSTPKEDIFTNSPLKTYFESPIFKKEGVWMKKKVKCYEKTLAEGDEQVSNLECKITKLENDLKNKEKYLKRLQKKLDEKEDENKSLLSDIESLKAKQESVTKELTKKIKEYDSAKVDMDEFRSQINQLQMREEEPNSVKRRKSSSQLRENAVLKSKEKEITLLKKEITLLKEEMDKLLIKNVSYKNEMADIILGKLGEKESPGAKNQSYEEEWYLRNLDRQEKEKLLSINNIVADNRKLRAKLDEAQLENERLLKEIENLKKKLIGKNRKSGTTELKDTSKSPETERFRKSFDETSFILNNSDCPIPDEQSIISSEPEALQCLEIPSEAVLWKMYDSQKPETESTYDINLNDDSVISINSNLGVINGLQLSNIQNENIKPDSLLNRKNKYELGDLNFDTFLNELKKLTKNGSFQKVLQVFGRQQKEINGTNGFNRLDLQEMLQMITECVSVAVALNAESSVRDLEDKCCSTDEKELCTVIELNIELDKLKNQLNAASQHENDLQACKNELEELKQKKNKLEKLYQTSCKVITEKRKTLDELQNKYTSKTENLTRKYVDLKKAYERLLDDNKKQQTERNDLRKFSANMYRSKHYYEKQYKLSQEENTKLTIKVKKLKEENEKLLKEKEAWSVGSAAYLRNSLPSRDSCIGLPNHPTIKPEFQSCTFAESSNESVLSGALHKNISHYVSENEDDFSYYNSLNSIKKEYDHERVDEIKRRNSLYPRQLQSSYPLEADLNTTYHSLYVQDKCREQQHHSKKLKLGEVIAEESSIFETPISKPKIKIVTPLSFQRLMKRVKRMKTPAKPKGSS